MEIQNTSKRPLKVPLAAGKKIFLGPGAKGHVNDKSAEHPPFQELLDSGAIEVVDGGRPQGGGASGSNGGISESTAAKGGGAAMRKSGDR